MIRDALSATHRLAVAGLTTIVLTLYVDIASAQANLPGPILDAGQTAQQEHVDRKARLRRLSRLRGIAAPEFYEYLVPKAQHRLANYPDLPVLRVVYSDKVFFDFNRDVLRAESAAVLDTVAKSLKLEPPDVTVFVAGHTDAVGSEEYNLGLGLRRAQAVAVALAARGLNRAQAYLVSFGKAVPLASNETEEGRARNRRVEFLFAARPEPIAVILAHDRTCTPDQSARGNNCPVQRPFIAQSVSLAPKVPGETMHPDFPHKGITLPGANKPVPAGARIVKIQSGAQTKQILIGSKTIEIDLTQKTFTMPPPEWR
ncbi:MAG: OmpA family protein [Alphaproteobacteria bacterium]|nr:OmpA family protein [Alphaproteobacteria bacterium]